MENKIENVVNEVGTELVETSNGINILGGAAILMGIGVVVLGTVYAVKKIRQIKANGETVINVEDFDHEIIE